MLSKRDGVIVGLRNNSTKEKTMNRYWGISLFLAGLLLFTACGPATTPLPTETPVPATTLAPSATMSPTVTPTPTATMAPEATLIPVDLLSPQALQEAIFVAAREDNVVAMKQYIVAGAKISEKDDLGVTVLAIAGIRSNEEMIKVLLDAGATIDVVAFHYAVLHANDNVSIVQAFIDHGADVNAPAIGIPGHTALMHAGEKGYIQIGKLLLANGADINKGDTYNDPAINVAAFHGQLEFVKMLVAMGAELNIRGMNGRTAVAHALSNGHSHVADFLKELGGTE
jgi:hypothetical protein